MQLLMMKKILVYIISLVENDMIEMLDLTLNLLDFLCNHTNRIFIKMKCGVVQKNFDFFSFVRRNI